MRIDWLAEAMNTPTGVVFHAVFGRNFGSVAEYDYWRNEATGRSSEELTKLMEKSMTDDQKKPILIGKGVPLAGVTTPMIGKTDASQNTTDKSFVVGAIGQSSTFKPNEADYRGNFMSALKPVNTVGFNLKSPSLNRAFKPLSTTGFGVGTKVKVALPKSQCPKCQQKAALGKEQKK